MIGGGFNGLETAAALATMGKTVTVLEAAERVLARVAAAETSLTVSETLAGLGVTLLTGWTGTGYRRDGVRVTAVEGRADSIACDVILVGIGAMADVALARAAGIGCNQGILTDGRLQTSDPHIWAIGGRGRDAALAACRQCGAD